MDTGGYYPGVKWPERRETDHSCPFSTEFMEPCLQLRMLYFINRRGNSAIILWDSSCVIYRLKCPLILDFLCRVGEWLSRSFFNTWVKELSPSLMFSHRLVKTSFSRGNTRVTEYGSLVTYYQYLLSLTLHMRIFFSFLSIFFFTPRSTQKSSIYLNSTVFILWVKSSISRYIDMSFGDFLLHHWRSQK
jgi:hypothetical protein